MKAKQINTVGRRKTAVARAHLKEGAGAVVINGKPLDNYFSGTARMVVMQPLVLLELVEKFDVRINVRGGGMTGQAGAARHAISRALIRDNPDLRGELKQAGYLTRDAREVESKKYGRHKARRRPQYSKR